MYSNPFKRTIKITENQNRKLEFSLKSCFIERLRLDTSQFKINAFHLNALGDILLLADNQIVFKLNSIGSTLLEKRIDPPKGFDKFRTVKTGLIIGTNDFYVNNFIVTKENVLLELVLPIKKMTNKNLQNPHIIDLVYSKEIDKYLVLYDSYFLIYTKEGQIEHKLDVQQGTRNRIIKEKNWIVLQLKDNTNLIIDFKGQPIGTYEFGNGNTEYKFSHSFDYFLCFSYSTKSQFFDLRTGKKVTLWAHPTFLKDYKELMYNDIEHNFGMSTASFSPDDHYIVGGAYHGKYVAWNVPELRRIELLPKPEYLHFFDHYLHTVTSGNLSTDIFTKPEFVTLENQVFFNNRGNYLTNIIFLENGDLFLTVIPDSRIILVWNREFVNIGVQQIEGFIDFYCDTYLVESTSKELTIYRQ